MTVGWGTEDRLIGQIARHARAVLYDELLAELLRQPLCDNSRRDVGPAARGEPHYEMDRGFFVPSIPLPRECSAR